MDKENLNLNRIQEFLSFYSNNSSLDQIIDASNYDSYIIRCKNGSKIHIKKKNRGKFKDNHNSFRKNDGGSLINKKVKWLSLIIIRSTPGKNRDII